MFQFPSNGKVYSKLRRSLSISSDRGKEFQFPSNGKVYSKGEKDRPAWMWQRLFQFPSNGKVYSKVNDALIDNLTYLSFNSLQTGKCIQSSKRSIDLMIHNLVSIPFKRESVFKVRRSIIASRKIFTSFNSLQTGKCIQRHFVKEADGVYLVFQFPSNGKVYSKTLLEKRPQGTRSLVSIPFKRESVFKDNRRSRDNRTTSFNSLQTGKCIQSSKRSIDLMIHNLVSIPFKRESVFKDSRVPLFYCSWLVSFNSLQTGKCIQRRLTTGDIMLSKNEFQFPSNGKVYSKAKRGGTISI